VIKWNRKSARRALIGISTVGALAGLTAAPASAAPPPALINSGTIPVCEHQTDVDTFVDVKPGDRLVIQASGSIWTGYWFIGRNGPQGLWWLGGSDYPAPNQPADGLLMRASGGYRFVGTGVSLNSTDPEGRLFFRINDNWPGNGNGCFTVSYQQYR